MMHLVHLRSATTDQQQFMNHREDQKQQRADINIFGCLVRGASMHNARGRCQSFEKPSERQQSPDTIGNK